MTNFIAPLCIAINKHNLWQGLLRIMPDTTVMFQLVEIARPIKMFNKFLIIKRKEKKTMLSVDLRTLLQKAFSDGFTVENLSNVTGVPINLINRVDDKNLSQEDIKTLQLLLYFLSQIYLEDITDGKNLESVVSALVSCYGLTCNTIAHYLDLTTSELNEFLAQPDKYSNSYNISLKLMNLFVAFVRNKKP